MGGASVIKGCYTGGFVADGAGVRLRRIIGSAECDYIDPFMLLDEFRSDNAEEYSAGFPMHPHRGIETVTYMKQGAFRHRDSRGNEGHLRCGDVQWMTAGRGILHEEMPEMDEGNLWGYQLWLKLPAALSMTEPGYQHIIHSHMAQLSENGISATIIAGKFDDTVGPAQTLFPVRYADFSIAHRGTSYTLSLTVGSVVVCYVHSGALVLGEEKIPVHRGTMVHCNNAGTLDIYAAEDGSGFLFMEAHPHHEPIVRGGPFVMNTPEEIHQAYRDYQRGLIG